MKNLLFAFVILSSLFIGACEDSTGNDCATTQVRFTSLSSNPYSIKIDNISRGTISGNSFKNFEEVPGGHSYKLEQLSGFVLFPTIKEGTFNLGCDEIEILFP